MDKKFLSPYDPNHIESDIYTMWEESGFFNPDVCIKKGIAHPNSEPFSIVLPPPNITGVLHAGHAATIAIQDIVVRAARMQGRKTLWIPGTDHAAIATQSKVEQIIYDEEKITRKELGREGLLKRIDTFIVKHKSIILNQIRLMGASVDWSRLAYTLDDTRYKAVYKAFKDMYDAGVIYQGERIVNWDPKLQTTISDDEIEWKEKKDSFYYFKYGPFTIGTARPETKFGDKYIVMHPDDKRYHQYKDGDKKEVEWIHGTVTATIIKDKAVDPEFGTGVMTITPWHDSADFEIAQRHNLESEQVIGYDGYLLPIAKEAKGINIFKARKYVVEQLQRKGLVESIDDSYVHRIATNSRGGGIIEPQIKKQWFMSMNKKFSMRESHIPGIATNSSVTLKQLMKHVVEKKHIQIIPQRFGKVYYHWIDNIKDWCISRQIWFGHRIPVWYKGDEVYCDVVPPKGNGWKQDEDTLDTWFSSGLWTFSTLGWPQKTDDLKTYHPTTLLETGYDILFFWIARMILMSSFHTGSIPFSHVYLHGLVRDENKKKMSKSLGNTIEPDAMIEKYGTDAFRMALIIGVTPGNDTSLSEVKIKAQKHFANKIWNISRFVLSNVDEKTIDIHAPLTKEDKKLQKEVVALADNVTKHITSYNLHLAGDALYQYVWHRFADTIIEDSKSIFEKGDSKAQMSRRVLLYTTLQTLLKLLHPFMPFITEEVWKSLQHKESSLLMIARWPSTTTTTTSFFKKFLQTLGLKK